MLPPRTFETLRLRLRPVHETDVDEVFAYASSPGATRFMNFARHRSPDESRAFVDRCVGCWASGDAFPWAIVEAASAAFVGLIELRIRPPKADFGYILAERFWGRGYASEAATAVVEWAIGRPDIHRVWATCHPDNVGSAKVLQKAGLAFEGRLENWEARPQLGEAAGPSLAFARLKPT